MAGFTSPVRGNLNSKILRLNNILPEEKASLWVTATEIRDRLVYCGVHRSLTVEMVETALAKGNRGEKILMKRQFKRFSYYVPQVYAVKIDHVTPNDQRFTKTSKGGRGKRINIVPEQGWFLTSVEASSLVDEVNLVLEENLASEKVN